MKAFSAVEKDIKDQLEGLFPSGFISNFSFERLQHYPRYLKAIGMRLEKLRTHPERDAQHMADWKLVAQPFEREWAIQRKKGNENPLLEDFRWLLEELRVSLFAQELKTPTPVSVKRLQKIWDNRAR